MDTERRVLCVTKKVDSPPMPEEWENSYHRFIDFLRERLKQFFWYQKGFQVAAHYASLVLTTYVHEVEVIIGPYDFRLYAYKFYSPSEETLHWLELGIHRLTFPLPHHQSSFLGFDGADYDSLEKVAGLTKEQIGVGQEQLVSAVSMLAVTEDPRERAHALIVLTRMIADSLRGHSFRDDLVTKITGKCPTRRPLKRRRSSNDMSYQEVFTLAGPISSADSYVDFDDEGYYYPNRGPGEPLLELCSIVIKGVDNPADLYGSVLVLGSFEHLYVYNTEKGENEDSVSISKTATGNAYSLLLTGPHKSLPAFDPVEFDVIVMDGHRDGEIIIEDIFTWNPFYGDKYDRLLSRKVKCKIGSATVDYIVLTHAVQATLDVAFFPNNCGDGDNPLNAANFYGCIQAGGYGDYDDSPYWSVLFSKKKKKKKENDSGIDVASKQLIPLLRSVVSAKLNRSLKVKAELFAPKYLSSEEHDYEIAKGNIEFTPQQSGMCQKKISGKYGEIGVTVTWAGVIFPN